LPPQPRGLQRAPHSRPTPRSADRGDGRLLACYAGEDGIKLLDRASGRRLAQLGGPGQGRVYDMTFNPVGTQLLVTDMDNQMIHRSGEHASELPSRGRRV